MARKHTALSLCTTFNLTNLMTCFKKKANYTAQRFVVIINYSLMRSSIYLSECKMLAGISKIQYIPLPDSNTQANAKKHKQTN